MSESVSLSEKNILIAYSDANVETMLKDDPDFATKGYVDPSKYSVSLKEGTTSTYIVKINAKTLQNDKAYKLRVIGKDMENIKLINETVNPSKHIGKKDEVVVVDKDLNSVKKTAMFAFSTSDKDTIKPYIKNAYTGDKVNADNLISTTKTNVGKDAKFTFEFSEEIAINDASKVVLQRLDGANWTDVSNGGVYHATSNPNPLTVSLTNASASSSINEAVVVELNETAMADATYRIYFKEGALKDTASTANLSEEYKVEFIATCGNDDYASTNVKYGLCGYDALGNITSFADGAGTIDAASTNGRIYVVFDETKLVAATDKNIVVKAGTEVVAGTLKEITVADSTTVFGLTGNATKTVYEFTPSKELKNNTAYTVTVSGVKDTAGNTIETKEFSFKTVKATNSVASVTIAGTQAADGSDSYTNVDRQKTIVIKLAQDAANDLKKTTGIKLADSTGAEVTDYKVIKVSGTEYKVELMNKDDAAGTNPLAANTKYTLTVNPVDNNNTTNQKVYTLVTGVVATDDLAPYIITDGILQSDGTTPLNEYQGRYVVNGVTGATSIKLECNEKIDASSVKITATKVSAADGEVKNVSVDATVDGANNHILNLAFVGVDDTTYDITVSGLKDANGNVMADKTIKLNNDGDAYTAAAKLATAETKVRTYEALVDASSKYDTDAEIKALLDTMITNRGSSGAGKEADDAVGALSAGAAKTALQNRISAVDAIIRNAATVATVEVADGTIGAASGSTSGNLTVVMKNANGVALDTAVQVAGIYKTTYAWSVTGGVDGSDSGSYSITADGSKLTANSSAAVTTTFISAEQVDAGDYWNVQVIVTQNGENKTATAKVVAE